MRRYRRISPLRAQSGRVLDAVVAEKRGRDNGRSPLFICRHYAASARVELIGYRCGSPEGEHESLDTRIQELDLELTLVDRLRLSYQLIQPLICGGAVALSVDVETVRNARRFAIE